MSAVLDDTTKHFTVFKDSLARRVLSSPAIKDTEDTGSNSTDELDEFTSFLADQVWPSLPLALRDASYSTRASFDPVLDNRDEDSDLVSHALVATPLSVVDTLTTFRIVSDSDAAVSLLRAVITDYLTEVCAPPPVWSRTRSNVDACEICERSEEDVPLTYHHLIPRSVHAKALKRKWHEEHMLGSVAWLCRPCHSTVHRVASNEDLARHFYTVNLLLEREDIQRWRTYAAKQRPSVKRG